MKKISIVGLGYVGLPLSLQFVRCGVDVLGIDIDPAKIEDLSQGRSYIDHISEDEISEAVGKGTLRVTTDFSELSGTEAVLICVPTPIGPHNDPDLSYVLETACKVAPHMPRGMLVTLESTTYPGTTDEELVPILEQGSNMKAGVDFFVAYSPEREDPGNPESKVAQIPKVMGGYTPACLEKAKSLYSKAIKTIVPVSSCRAAEATKLLENIFRSVNIALVNELKQTYDSMGIDIWEVIHAAATKPFGFMAFYPGPGLGGHCIPIDPFYLTWKAKEFGQTTRFIELAGEINTAMPDYVIGRVSLALNSKLKSIKGSKVLLVGLAYKANVDDDRESPGYVLMNKLSDLGATVEYYDPFIPVIRPSREHAHWAGKKSVKWVQEEITDFDLALVATAHDNVDYEQLLSWSACVVDTRNVTNGLDHKECLVSKS